MVGKSVDKIVVCGADCPRHRGIIEELRKIGACLKLIQDCDVSGALATCLPDSGVDLLYGIGGTPEAVIAACAMKCLGGKIKAQLADNDGRPQPGRVYSTEEMVRGDCVLRHRHHELAACFAEFGSTSEARSPTPFSCVPTLGPFAG